MSENDIRKLEGFPLLKRLKSLLLNNNRIWYVGLKHKNTHYMVLKLIFCYCFQTSLDNALFIYMLDIALFSVCVLKGDDSKLLLNVVLMFA